MHHARKHCRFVSMSCCLALLHDTPTFWTGAPLSTLTKKLRSTAGYARWRPITRRYVGIIETTEGLLAAVGRTLERSTLNTKHQHLYHTRTKSSVPAEGGIIPVLLIVLCTTAAVLLYVCQSRSPSPIPAENRKQEKTKQSSSS